MRRVLAAAAAILGVLALFAGEAPERSADGSSAGSPKPALSEVEGARRQLSAPASRWRYSRRAAGATLIAPVELAEWIRDRKPHLRVVDVRAEAEFEEYHLPRAERLTPATTFAPDDTVVLVAGGSVHARNVYVLRGGVQAWIDEVLNPTITADAAPSARAAYERASIVSRYFGGVPRVVDKLPAMHSVRRRGC
jgi:rhodanese-related sulfurtransferase